MSNTNITTTTETTTVVVEENIVRIELNNIGVQGVPGANNDPVYVTVTNKTGALLTKGSIVYVSGGNGVHTQVSLALATSDATSARVLGWLADDIANNADGLCMVEGYLDGVDTQGVTQGAQLYLSGTVAGAYQVTKPVAPIHLVYVGVCVKAASGNGRVYVKVQNGYELDELHDVLIVSPQNNQVLAYDSATQLWKNATNAPDGVTSITAVSPLTGGTITSTGSIGLDQTALSITKSQVSDFTSGTVTSASTAQQAGTAVYAVNSGTAVYATTSGTAVYSANSGTAVTISGTITKSQVSDFTSGTVAQADNATTSGTAVYATNSGTAVFATTAGTSTTISGDITRSQVSDFASGTVAQAGTATYAVNSGTAIYANTSGTAVYATNSGTAVFATNASTAVSVSGSAITQSQVVNLVSDLANTAKLNTANTFTVGGHVVNNSGTTVIPLILRGVASQTSNMLEIQDEGFGTYASISKFGTTRLGGAVMTGGRLMVQAGGALVGLQVRDGGTGANIQEWQSSAGSILGRVSSSGSFLTSARITAGSTATAPAQITSFITDPALPGIIVQGAASQSADLLQVQNSAASNLVYVNSGGGLFATQGIRATNVSNLATSANSRMSMGNGGAVVDTSVAGNIPLQVQNINASPTGDLTRWLSTASAVLARITAAGSFQVTATSPVISVQATTNNRTITIDPANGAIDATNTALHLNRSNALSVAIGLSSDSRLSVGQGGATPAPSILFASNGGGLTGVPVAIVRGAASQSAVLQSWQNSAGTQLASVSADGSMSCNQMQFTSGGILGSGGQTSFGPGPSRNVYLNAAGGNYGGGLAVTFIGNASTVPTSNPTGGGILYVEAGALKFRGSSGTITTIANA